MFKINERITHRTFGEGSVVEINKEASITEDVLESHIEPAIQKIEGYEDCNVIIKTAIFDETGIVFSGQMTKTSKLKNDFSGHINCNLDVQHSLSK